jgi:uncharacterized protein DUF4013
MSLDQATAPTEAGGPVAGEIAAARTRLEYFRAYQQALQSPNWFVNLLWGMLAYFSSGVIPIVGPMVWTGYLYECLEVLATTRGRTFPDFDVNRFGEYLTRGLWPFLVQLVIWLALWATWIVVYVGLFIVLAIAGAAGEQYAPLVMAVGFPLLVLALATVVVLPLVLLAPLMLRAGLSQDLSATFQLSWCADFLRRVGMEIAASTLFLLITGSILTVLGCTLLGVGTYLAFAWITMASTHLSWQLYELYLARGGAPVPLKPRRLSPPPYPFPPVSQPAYSLPPPASHT